MLPQIILDAYRNLLRRGRIGEGADKVAAGFPPALGYGVARDEKSSGTNGGTFTTGAWQTRDLGPTVLPNKYFITTTTPARFLLNFPGRWLIWGSAPGYKVNDHQTRIYNVTDAAVEFLGTVERSYSAQEASNRSHFCGIVSPTVGPTYYEVQHRGGATRLNDGFGGAANLGVEVYSIVHALMLTVP